MAPKTITGKVRDIQPNGAQPRLELYFSNDDLDSLPGQHKDEITLVLDGHPWTGTIGLRPNNDPYVHSNVHDRTGKRSCTELFLQLGLAEEARLRFVVRVPGHLELVEILDAGTWRPGGHPDHRRAQAPRNPRTAPPKAAPSDRPRGTSTFPFNDRDAVLRLADLYWSKITASERAEEQAFERELPGFRARRELDKPIFVRLARWKSVRKTPDYEANADHEVRSASRAAFAARNDAEALAALTQLRGVAVRTASALLHWMRPERYPILDVRVLAALGETMPSSFEDPRLYTRTADRIRNLARALEVDLRTLDRALWTWDKTRASSQ